MENIHKRLTCRNGVLLRHTQTFQSHDVYPVTSVK